MEIHDLSASEKILLAEELWDSAIKDESDIALTNKQKLELEKRLMAYENDRDVGGSWLNVKSRIISNQ